MAPQPDTTVGGLGEFGLIRQITGRFAAGPGVLVGPGDDCAVVAAPDGRVAVTTDVLVEGVHFRLDWSSAVEVGRKAAAQSLADVAAMGARPTAIVVGLAAPATLPADWALGLSDGLAAECAVAGAYVVGGDVVRSDRVVVSVTALGDLAGRRPVLRSGAVPGDSVVVNGPLGRSAAGLALHLAGDAALLERFAPLAAAHRVPAPPYAAGPALADAGGTSLVDVSDGLLQDLGHVAEASGAVLEVDAGALEAYVTELAGCADALGADPWEWVLGGGEEHSLAGTAPAGAGLPPGTRVVGRVVAADGRAPGVVLRGRALPARLGWDHYAG
ncbi:thiamine-phosphate kinase [Motilibacter deserti]|uniref:Thiamine-monophosphate kinase n=1 Tax=Motilibacter deserti TaxID=2714956 RepID=A0ABX0GRZ2_9ACTN|nr:thiamine-phosphate kinase [Motilibacter deserti]